MPEAGKATGERKIGVPKHVNGPASVGRPGRMRHLLITLGLTLCLAAVGGCRGQAIAPPPAQSDRPLRADQPDQFHRLVREAALDEQSKAVGRTWEEVRARYDAAGYVPVSARENQITTDRVYLVRAAAWSSRTGLSHDLVVKTSVDGRDPAKSADAKPGEVVFATAGLVARPEVEFAKLSADGAYPSDSAVGRCLATAEFREAVTKYPIVKRVEVTYDLIRDRWLDAVPYGFHVWIDLGESLQSDDAGSRLFFTVESGLDPPEDWHGQRLPAETGARPVFGEVRYWGGSEWRRGPTSSAADVRPRGG